MSPYSTLFKEPIALSQKVKIIYEHLSMHSISCGENQFEE